MKNLEQLLAATILAMALSVSAYAGDMSAPTIVSPPPPDNTTGVISSPALAGVSEDILLDVILGVISLP